MQINPSKAELSLLHSLSWNEVYAKCTPRNTSHAHKEALLFAIKLCKLQDIYHYLVVVNTLAALKCDESGSGWIRAFTRHWLKRWAWELREVDQIIFCGDWFSNQVENQFRTYIGTTIYLMMQDKCDSALINQLFVCTHAIKKYYNCVKMFFKGGDKIQPLCSQLASYVQSSIGKYYTISWNWHWPTSAGAKPFSWEGMII